MTTLSARYVRKPRADYSCDACCKRIVGPYIRLYGMSDNEPPWTLRLHPTETCAPNLSNEPKLAAAIRAACGESEAQG